VMMPAATTRRKSARRTDFAIREGRRAITGPHRCGVFIVDDGGCGF
jgi:hypothetical protein